MTENNERLQHAVNLARNGNREQARDYFIEIIEDDPNNINAWAWLIDLLDDLEDRIHACEQVLAKNPNNLKLQAKYQNLVAQRPSFPSLSTEPELLESPRIAPLDQAQTYLAQLQLDRARKILISFVKTDKQNERAWLLLSEAVEDKSTKISALKQALRVNPRNQQTRQKLKDLDHSQSELLDLALKYEEEGKFDEALAVLHNAIQYIHPGIEFDKLYAEIDRLEKRKKSGVVHIRPNYSIVRLMFGPPLLYFLLMLVHNQMNLFAFTPLLWLGVLFSLGGGFLLAVANVRSRHPLWVKVFDEASASGTPLTRLTVSIAGWLLLIISFAYLLQISYERMSLLATNSFVVP